MLSSILLILMITLFFVESCSDGAFHCTSGLTKCIADYQVCDKKNDCSDGSDEHNCNNTCPSWKHPCGDGGCVYNSWICDGDKDCNNGHDEMNCSGNITLILSWKKENSWADKKICLFSLLLTHTHPVFCSFLFWNLNFLKKKKTCLFYLLLADILSVCWSLSFAFLT